MFLLLFLFSSSCIGYHALDFKTWDENDPIEDITLDNVEGTVLPELTKSSKTQRSKFRERENSDQTETVEAKLARALYPLLSHYPHLLPVSVDQGFTNSFLQLGVYNEKDLLNDYGDFDTTEKRFYPSVLPRSIFLSPLNALLGCKFTNDPTADCYGARFSPSDGIQQPCTQHSECYLMREPVAWCRIKPPFFWTKEGCHCDKKLQSCVVNRVSLVGLQEYTFCKPIREWYCPQATIGLPFFRRSKS